MKTIKEVGMIVLLMLVLFLLFTYIVHPDIKVVDTQFNVSEFNEQYYQGEVEKDGENVYFLAKKEYVDYYDDHGGCVVGLRWFYPKSDYQVYDLRCR